METTYIKHHGIKGQKWGQRNGPPYPIATGNHSASEKRAGGVYKKKVKYGGVKDLSLDELKSENTRRAQESQYIKSTAGGSHMSNNRPASEMSTAELQAYNTRRQAEDQYKDFQKKDYEKWKESQNAGLKTAKSMVDVTRENANMLEKSVKEYYDNRRKRQKAAMDLSNMSDDELRRRINRMDLERRYRDLTPAEVSRGERFWTNATKNTSWALTAASGALDVALKVKQFWDD